MIIMKLERLVAVAVAVAAAEAASQDVRQERNVNHSSERKTRHLRSWREI